MEKRRASRIKVQVPDTPAWRSAERVCSILWSAGKECYAIGGAVRDLLSGREAADIDLATNARPEEVMELAEKAGCKAYPTGIRFGTVKVTCDGVNFHDVGTYRREVYKRDVYKSKEWRKPQVEFAGTLEEDVSRRDFTINALALDLKTGEVVDYFGGLEDLQAGRIRAVGDPEQRFREDPLRIIRMCRFASVMGFTVDERTMEAARRMAGELSWVPAERIMEELRKALEKSPKPSLLVRCLSEAGALKRILPEVEALKGHQQPPPHAEDAFEHTLCVLDRVPRDYKLRLAALLHDIGKPATRREQGPPWYPGHEEEGARMAREALRRLRSSRREIEEVEKLVKLHMFQLPNGEKEARRTIVRLGRQGVTPDLFWKLLELKRADIECTTGMPEDKREKALRGLSLLASQRMVTPLSREELAVRGDDLVEAGVEPAAIGTILDKLLDWVADDPSRNTREQLLKRAVTLARSIGALKTAGADEERLKDGGEGEAQTAIPVEKKPVA